MGSATEDVRLDDGDVNLNAGKRVVLTGDYGVELYGGNALDQLYREVHKDELDQDVLVEYESQNGAHNGGCLYFQAGDSEKATGGNVTIRGGRGLSNQGGDVEITTGVGNSTDQALTITYEDHFSHDPATYGRVNSNYDHDAYGHTHATNRYASSGSLKLHTADAFPHLNRGLSSGLSGNVSIGTGKSGYGDSGKIEISTGNAVRGVGGDIIFSVGNGTDVDGYGEGPGEDGGRISLTAGLSTSHEQSGGNVEITAGLGISSSASTTKGGDLKFKAGNAVGAVERSFLASGQPWFPYLPMSADYEEWGWRRNNRETDEDHGNEDGGAVQIAAGDSLRGTGGSVALAAGESTLKDGGNVTISGGDAHGSIQTCDTQQDPSCDKGGSVYIFGGGAHAAYGGNLTMVSGKSNATHSGSIDMRTENSGAKGISGGIHLNTGKTTFGESGIFNVTTGDGLYGSGGDIAMVVGTAKRDDTAFYPTPPTSGHFPAGQRSCTTFYSTTLENCMRTNCFAQLPYDIVPCILRSCPDGIKLIPEVCVDCLVNLSTGTPPTTTCSACSRAPATRQPCTKVIRSTVGTLWPVLETRSMRGSPEVKSFSGLVMGLTLISTTEGTEAT